MARADGYNFFHTSELPTHIMRSPRMATACAEGCLSFIVMTCALRRSRSVPGVCAERDAAERESAKKEKTITRHALWPIPNASFIRLLLARNSPGPNLR